MAAPMSSFSAFGFHDGTSVIQIRDARRSPTLVHNVVDFEGHVADIIHPAFNPLPSPTPSVNSLRPWMTPRIDRRRPVRPAPNVFTLLPLHVAAARPDIKYRREGFEMEEERRRARTPRVEVPFDEELALRCFC